LGRPGHARKFKAIADWLNHTYGKGGQVAWSILAACWPGTRSRRAGKRRFVLPCRRRLTGRWRLSCQGCRWMGVWMRAASICTRLWWRRWRP